MNCKMKNIISHYFRIGYKIPMQIYCEYFDNACVDANTCTNYGISEMMSGTKINLDFPIYNFDI